MTQYLPLIKSVGIDCTQFENTVQVETNTRCNRTPVINSQVTEIELSSKTFGGGRVRVDLPMGNLLSHTAIVLKLSPEAMNLAAGWTLSQGWGYDAIEYYEVQSEQGTFLRFEMQDVLIKVLADCENESKRAAILNLGGQAFNGVVAGPVDTDPAIAYVHLYLPWSNVSSAKVIPYDSSILNKPVSINIQFRDANKLFSRSSAITAPGTLPTGFSSAYVAMQTGILAAGPSASIRNAVSAQGDEKYVYGWMYPNVYQTPEQQGKAVGDVPMSFKLENMMNGSIQSIDLCLERTTLGDNLDPDLQTRINSSNVPINRAIYEPLSNVQLKYGGQVIYRAGDELYKLMALSEYPVSNQYEASYYSLDNTVVDGAGYVENTKSVFWTHIQLSQFANPQFFLNMVQEGVQLSNNMVELVFNVPDISRISNGSGVDPPIAQPKYKVRAIYNMQVGLSTYKGATDWEFMAADSRGPYTISG